MVITPEITKTPKKLKNKKPPSLSKNTHWGAIALILLLTLIGYLLIVSEAAAHGLDTKALEAPRTVIIPQKPSLPTPQPKIAVAAKSSPTGGSKTEVEMTIRRIAEEMGYKNADYLVAVAKCESGLNPKSLGDGAYRSRGIWQISHYHHPTITDEMAYSVEWSTRWSIEQFLNNRDSLWTCARKLHALR